jgi:hypothetical protein
VSSVQRPDPELLGNDHPVPQVDHALVLCEHVLDPLVGLLVRLKLSLSFREPLLNVVLQHGEHLVGGSGGHDVFLSEGCWEPVMVQSETSDHGEMLSMSAMFLTIMEIQLTVSLLLPRT